MNSGCCGAEHVPRDIGAKLLALDAGNALDIRARFGRHAVLPLIHRAATPAELASQSGHAAGLLKGALDGGLHAPEYRLPRPDLSSIAIRLESHNDEAPYRETMTFGDRLKKLREGADYSGETLGELLGGKLAVSKQTVSHWERNRYEPDIAQLCRLCEIFNVSATFLVQGLDKPDLGPGTRIFAERYQRLKPSEQDKWLALVDIARAPSPPDAKRKEQERVIEANYAKLVSEDPNGTTGNTEPAPPDALEALQAGRRANRPRPTKTLDKRATIAAKKTRAGG